MRKLLALVVLLCGAASADAAATQKWCSDGFDKPAELTLDQPPVLRIGTQTEQLDPEFWPESVTFATIDYAQEGDEHKDEQVVIYRDRVFWPCR